jgi:hypothetical protein
MIKPLQMKHLITITLFALFAFPSFAQKDSTTRKSDTLRIGKITIIRRGVTHSTDTFSVADKKKKKHKNVSTEDFIFDLGFANWTDNTNYAGGANYIYNRPGTSPLAQTDFKLKSWKSVNVNIWLFMQKVNLVKHFLNLKYGIGLELNNYRFKSNVSFKENYVDPANQGQYIINHAFVFRDSVSFSKNKLAADYVTVPLMINIQTDPKHPKKSVAISAGISAGYLYSSRNKQTSSERGKRRNKGDYDLERWKFSYIGEIGISAVRLYGSYSPTSIFENGLNMMPYTIGIRFSNW